MQFLKESLFSIRVQQNGESIDRYITNLYTLAEVSAFGEVRNELIRD